MKPLHHLLFVAFVIGACASPETQTPTAKATETIAFQSTETPGTTAIPNIPTASATTTPKNWPISEIPACVRMKVKDVLPDNYEIHGTLLSIDMPPWSPPDGFGKYPRTRLYNFNLSKRVEVDLVYPEDFQESAKTKIAYLRVEDLYASPDFLKAVYLITAYEADEAHSKSWLEIYDSDTSERTRVPWEKEWEYIIGWINADHFAIRAGGSTLFLNSHGIKINSIHTSNLPDYSNPRTYNQNAYVIWGGYKKFGFYGFPGPAPSSLSSNPKILNPTLDVYNPSMEYVIYTEVKDGKPGIALYEIKSQQKIIETFTYDEVNYLAYGGEPVWSPSGRQAVMLLPAAKNSSKHRLFLLDTTGNLEKLTDFDVVGPYSWSPDESFIAFWLSQGKQIGILDLNSKDLKVLCVDDVYSTDVDDIFPDTKTPTSEIIVWLPNNNQLLTKVTKFIGDTQQEGIILIDLEKATFIDLKWNAISPIWLQP